MKNLGIALLLLVTLSANKCADKTNHQVAGIKDKKWVMQTLNGEALGLPAGIQTPWLQVTGDKLMGFGGCNNLMGSCILVDGDLAFSNIGSTKKYCEGIQPTESAIKKMLGQVDSYKFDGTVLTLMGSGNELATLKAE